MLVSVQFLLLLFVCQSMGAPSSSHRGRSDQSDDGGAQNPFSSGPEQLRILQQYLKQSDSRQENALNLKRETVILHLFLLHDYDKSGHLDGLELMQLLSGILSQSEHGRPPSKSVIFLVDEVLDKQDLNRDGLLSAPELLVPPVYASQPLNEEDPSADTIHVAIPPPRATSENLPHADGELAEDSPAAVLDSLPQDTINNQSNGHAHSPGETDTEGPEEPGADKREELKDETLPETVEEDETLPETVEEDETLPETVEEDEMQEAAVTEEDE